jgi:hypothetical protein
MLAHHRRRHIEPLGRRDEAAGFDDLAEDPNARQCIHCRYLYAAYFQVPMQFESHDAAQ